MANPTLTLIAGGESTTVAAAGPWIAAHSSALEQLVVADSLKRATHRIVIDIAGVEQLDTLGAWSLERLARSFRDHGQELVFVTRLTAFVACSTGCMT